jgi:hypothetical protein
MVPPTDRRAIFRACVKESQAAETRMRRPSKLGLSTWEPASFQRQELELWKTQWLSLWEYHEPYIGWLADVQLLEGHNCRKRVNKCCSVLATEKMKNTQKYIGPMWIFEHRSWPCFYISDLGLSSYQTIVIVKVR